MATADERSRLASVALAMMYLPPVEIMQSFVDDLRAQAPLACGQPRSRSCAASRSGCRRGTVKASRGLP